MSSAAQIKVLVIAGQRLLGMRQQRVQAGEQRSDGGEELRGQRACEAYDQEAERPSGRRWVKDQMSEGMACQLNDALMSTNLGQLPPRDTIFALSDGERTLTLTFGSTDSPGFRMVTVAGPASAAAPVFHCFSLF